MEHTPYGYRIENGKAVIDEKTAEQVRLMYRLYLDGAGLCTAAEKAGISALHSGAGYSAIPITLAMNIILPLSTGRPLNGQNRNGSGGQRLLAEAGNRRSGRKPGFPLLSI